MEGSGDGGYLDEFVSVDLELSTLLSSVLGRSSTSTGLLEDEEQPEGGWDLWCSKISRKGKVARVLRTISKNVMSFEWNGGEEKTRKAMRRLSKKIQLKLRLMAMYRDWQVYGRTFAEPIVEDKDNKFFIHDLRIIPPFTIRVFRDSKEDLDALKVELGAKQKYAKYLATLEVGAGDKVVGYIQKIGPNGSMPVGYHTHDTGDHVDRYKEAIFFLPSELIFIPRYPDHDMPDGISLLRENYDTIMDKLGYARSQSIMVKRHIDPKLIFTIPREHWGSRSRIQQEIKYGIKAGLDIFVPEGMSINVLQSSGMGSGVSEAIKFTENEFNAAMGFADSFTSSESSNRSVGEIQLQFFERDINAEREIFSDILDKTIIHPYIYKNFNTRDYPDLKWADIQPKDRKVCVQLATPFINMMTINQLLIMMEDIGYPVSQKDVKEFKKNVETARGGMMGGMGDIGGGFDGFGTPMGGGGMDMPEASGTNQWGVPGVESPPDADSPDLLTSLEEKESSIDLSAGALQAIIKKMYALEEEVERLRREVGTSPP